MRHTIIKYRNKEYYAKMELLKSAYRSSYPQEMTRYYCSLTPEALTEICLSTRVLTLNPALRLIS